jgi:MFS family permease
LINYSATFGVGFLLSLYLQKIKMLTPEKAGLILLCQPLVQAVFSPLTGKLSDKVEPGLLASAGMSSAVAGLFVLSFLRIDTGINVIIISLVILGAGFALFSSPNSNAIMSAVEKKYYGVGGATLSTMRIIGQIMSMGAATLVFSIFLGDAKISAENQKEFLKCINITFTIFTALCFVGIFFSMIRGKVHKKG